ncbi:MAG TPA: ATP-binding protein [Thermoanaerobaculia bacterium]|nr:ATP-binding protein [Thermoanaerobaculia bacterium]
MGESLRTRLAAHRTLAGTPPEQLEWLVARGHLLTLEPGGLLATKGSVVMGLYIILTGHLTIHVDRGAGPYKAMEWRGGDVSGFLPYSRLAGSPGDVRAEEPTEIFVIPRNEVPALIRDCHELTSILVHVMVDRARQFTSSDLREEKMSSLGKLAAGLAHELNNPASAVARSAKGLGDGLVALERAARVLGAANLSGAQEAAVERARSLCLRAAGATFGRSPIEQADREDALAEWLRRHGADETAAEALAESAVTVESLDELAGALDGAALRATLPWLVAGCATSRLVSEIETSATKIHSLVTAVKGFTYMDQATMPKPVDVGRGLADTLAVLNAKARGRSVSVSLDVPDDLPRVMGFGGELNQVWANLVDNALDAAKGAVAVSARLHGSAVVVRVVDDGPGLAPESRERIFDPFFTTKPVGQGTGLGLDIARRVVHRHQGEIDVDSRSGRTEFRVTLPLGAGKG